jgi:hypothetical protein
MIIEMGRKHKRKKHTRSIAQGTNQNDSVVAKPVVKPVIPEPVPQAQTNPIWDINTLKASLIITLLGFVVYLRGLKNPFLGDDTTQIVNNPVVHSISHIILLFEGGTFYQGQGIAPLNGYYYRPLMMTVFSLLYSIFGLHTFYFHLFQLLLCIGSAILLYMVFEYFFDPMLSLVLALIFLVHPLNSQVVFAIPSMQDALFFFFGILGFWLLLRFKSVQSLGLVALCLFLCMLAKETAVVFIAVSLLYLLWFNRERLYKFIGFMVLPTILYLVLSINAVGISRHANIAPIDRLDLVGRLFTAPSILLFFITKFVFPWKLASAYYWVYPTFSFQHVLLPLIIDLAIIALFVYLAFVIRQKVTKVQYYTYLFFGIWASLGLLTCLQIIPLDMTACETWFYFSMAGVLGMIGIILLAFQDHIRPSWFIVIAALVIGILGIRTILRAGDWSSAYTLASHDLVASSQDYVAYNDLAVIYTNQGNYRKAKFYEERSVNIFPTYIDYNSLGVILVYMGNYSGAMNAYERGMQYGYSSMLDENLASLTLVAGNPNSNRTLLIVMLQKFPKDGTLWIDLALLEDRYGDNTDAKTAIQIAASYGETPSFYQDIIDNRPFILRLPGNKYENI